MAREIERKYLVSNTDWHGAVTEQRELIQGYLSQGDGPTVRVRLEGALAWLTIKGRPQGGFGRPEFEYPVPAQDAREMLLLCGGTLVEKTRYHVPVAGHLWEVDVFSGANAGLVLAEIELTREDETFVRPDWLGEEVTRDPRYTNAGLSRNPWCGWGCRR